MNNQIILSVVISCLLSNMVVAQNSPELKGKAGDLSEKYERNSVSVVATYRDDRMYNAEIVFAFEKVSLSDKYNNHNDPNWTYLKNPYETFGDKVGGALLKLDQKIAEPSGASADTTSKIKGPKLKREEQIESFILKSGYSRDLIKKWFVGDDGNFGFDLVSERAMYNATDSDIKMAQSGKYGNTLITMKGEKLINNTYILVYDINGVKTMEDIKKLKEEKAEKLGKKLPEDKSTTETVGYTINSANLYVFRLIANDSVMNAIYRVWIDKSTSPKEKTSKQKQLEFSQFPVEFVKRFVIPPAKSTITVPKGTEGNINMGNLLEKAVQKVYENGMFLCERKIPEFRVKTVVSSNLGETLTAKVGRKEGLRLDQRYMAFEFVMKEEGAPLTAKKIGSVRATNKITDNRTVASGESEGSRFIQTSGKKLERNTLLEQRLDFGIGLGMNYYMPSSSGSHFGGRADLNLSPLITKGLDAMFSRLVKFGMLKKRGDKQSKFIGGFRAYMDIMSGKEKYDVRYSISSKVYGTMNVNYFSYQFGVSKDIYFLSRFSVSPYVGMSSSTYDLSQTNIDRFPKLDSLNNYQVIQSGVIFGARLGIAIKPSIRFITSFENAINKYSESPLDVIVAPGFRWNTGIRFNF